MIRMTRWSVSIQSSLTPPYGTLLTTVYADDFVEAHDVAMNHDESIVVNVGTGQGTSVNQVFQHLQALTGYDASPIYEAARPGDVRHIALDASRAKMELGWEPRVGLLEGLEKTVAYMRSAND